MLRKGQLSTWGEGNPTRRDGIKSDKEREIDVTCLGEI